MTIYYDCVIHIIFYITVCTILLRSSNSNQTALIFSCEFAHLYSCTLLTLYLPTYIFAYKMRSFEHILQLINLRLVSLLIVLVLCTQTSCEPGYLKFCGDEEKASVYSTSCSKGLWLNAPVNPGCVCATGV